MTDKYTIHFCFHAHSCVQHALTKWATWRVSPFCVLCAQCSQCLWIVHFWFPLRFSLTYIYVNYRIIYYLFVWAFGKNTDIWQMSLWRAFLARIFASANTWYFYQQYRYIMFILQCQNVKSISQIVLKRAETDINPIILNGVLNHVRYTVIVSYNSLYTNQILWDCYLLLDEWSKYLFRYLYFTTNY